MPIGTIRLLDKVNGCGCVQDDADRAVHFFNLARVAPEYVPRKDDRVLFNVEVDLRSGRPEAHLIQLVEPLAHRRD